MPRGVYNRTASKKRTYKKREQTYTPLTRDALPRLLTFDNREVLMWDDKFYIEVSPKFETSQEDTKQLNEPPKEKKEKRCGKCHKLGHTGWTCESKKIPKLSDNNDDDDEPPEKAEVTRDQVQELKDQGLNSLRVAQKLNCTLKAVNEHWN